MIPVDRPTSARAYGWLLGGKDNFSVDREIVLETLKLFPECLDIARQNRRFLYRTVRHLVQGAGISQFIDMGCGLPTDNNVHQVAHRFDPSARVVYVDIDPIVLAYGRALLADKHATTVVTADMRVPEAIVDHPDTRRLIDFSQPVAVLYLSVGHHLTDDAQVGTGVRDAVRGLFDAHAVSGSYLAFSQIVHDDPEAGARLSRQIGKAGIPWQTRAPAEIDAMFEGLEPVEPGLVNLDDWRPDPTQPALDPVPPQLKDYDGITGKRAGAYEYGGILRKP